MRRSLLVCCLLFGACASHPRAEQNAAYQQYWQCAFQQARGPMADSRLSAHEAAMRAQAQCYDAYVRYRDARRAYSRSVVSSADRDMAVSLADAGALQQRRNLTRRLTGWIVEARR